MTGDKVFNVIGAIVAIGMVTTIVGHPRTAEIVRAVGTAGTNFLATAMGTSARPRGRR